MRREEKNIDNKNRRRESAFSLSDLKVQIIMWFMVPITISLLVIMYCTLNTYRIQKEIAQKAYTEINKTYDNEDIESIEAVRKFFLFYYDAEEYDIVFSAFQIKVRETVNQAQILIGKYGEILLDENKKLTFDKNSRDMKITNEAFELKLYFNVDVPLSDCNVIPTCNGSWKEKDNDYMFYKFGKAIEGSLISTPLKMLDWRTVTSNDKKFYEANSPIYVFKERQFSRYSKFCVYVVETGEFREFSNIKEIEATDDFVSFRDKDNNLFVYCIQHDFIIQAGETDGLYWTYDPYIYLPKGFNDVLKKQLFVEHKQCNK